MPAEKVQSRVRYAPGQEPAEVPETPHVKVSWGTDHGYVQVASLFDRAHGAQVVLDEVNGWLRAAGLPEVPGREELQKLAVAHAGAESIVGQFGVGFEGFWTSLDERHDVNRLIQTLKRARDGAFGKDE